ncbi:MAG: 2-aminoethylphosphonate--pyruvate transaminase [Raoultibacter sp.]
MTVPARKVLLNPGPATTTDSVKQAQIVSDICPRETEFGDLMRSVQSDLTRIVHGGEDYTSVLFCGSGTICIDAALSSLLPEGAKVLVVDNGVYSSRAVEVCTYYGLSHIDLKLPINRPIDVEAVRAVLSEEGDIALVYTTHHETATGVLNPLREIGALAHEYGALFVVDTTSSYAMIPLDVVRDNIDACMASAQKGIQAMTGLSFIIAKRAVIEESAANPKRSYYCNLYRQYDQFERTGQMHFTPPVQVVYAARQALDEYFAEGEQAKWERHQHLAQAIHEGLSRLGFSEAIDSEYQSQLVVSVSFPDCAQWDFRAVHDYCYERGFTIYPGKIAGQDTFRLCTLGALEVADIEAFFKVLEAALEDLGIATARL